MRKFQLRWILQGVCTSIMAFVMIQSTAPFAYSGWTTRGNWASNFNEAPIQQQRSSKRADFETPESFAPGSNSLSVDIGQYFLMGNLGNYPNSIGTKLHYTYGVSDTFGFDSQLGYSNHGDGDLSMTSLVTGVRMNLAWYDRVIPYFVFGLGFYKPNYRMPDASNVSPLLFGIHMGPGIDLLLTRQFFFGANFTLHDIFGNTQKTNQGTKDVGGTFASFCLRAGFSF